MEAKVGAVVEEDGSGIVAVEVGFDDAALREVGNPDVKLATDDLRAAGWRFDPAERRPDGFTWVRAERSFATPEEGAAILRSLNPAVVRDVSITRDESFTGTTWTFDATVDLTQGLAPFSDAEVAELLAGDPFGGNVAAIEAREGRPATEMIGITLAVALPGGEAVVWTPSFSDATPTELNTTATVGGPIPLVGGDAGGIAGALVLAAVVVALIAGLVVVRRRFRTIDR